MVEIFDEEHSKGETPADPATGIWSKTIFGLSETSHTFTAKACYGSGQVSPARMLTVISELIVDTTPIILNGQNYSIDHVALGWLRTGSDPASTSETRTVSGGVPPYSFTTSAPVIASVDCAGCIRSEGNGEAVITVSDTLGQSKTIRVTCTNVTRLLIQPSPTSHSLAMHWIDAHGVRINQETGPTIAASLSQKYKANGQQQHFHVGLHTAHNQHAMFRANTPPNTHPFIGFQSGGFPISTDLFPIICLPS
jgi:hypothetical protein